MFLCCHNWYSLLLFFKTIYYIWGHYYSLAAYTDPPENCAEKSKIAQKKIIYGKITLKFDWKIVLKWTKFVSEFACKLLSKRFTVKWLLVHIYCNKFGTKDIKIINLSWSPSLQCFLKRSMRASVRYQRHVSLNVIIIVANTWTQYHIKYEKIWRHSAIVKHYVASNF